MWGITAQSRGTSRDAGGWVHNIHMVPGYTGIMVYGVPSTGTVLVSYVSEVVKWGSSIGRDAGVMS